MFLGSFLNTNDSIFNTTAENSDITTISLSNMIIDELYVTKDTDEVITLNEYGNYGLGTWVKFNWDIPTTWRVNTVIHAYFQDNIYAGNVNYSSDIVNTVKIKRRYEGEFTWKTVYEKPIHSAEDFAIQFYDYYVPSNRKVEYAYVAVIGGVDADALSTSITSEFECYFLCSGLNADREVNTNKSYPIILDVDNQVTYNRETTTITSPGSKYPYVVHNGMTKYYSGTLKATFIQMNDDCSWDRDNGWKYRNEIDDFLANGEAKILKSFEGDMWMVNIVGSIPRTNNGHYQHISHSIEWIEAGDANSVGDLYDEGFINTDVDRE